MAITSTDFSSALLFFVFLIFHGNSLLSTNTTSMHTKPKPKGLSINLIHSHLLLPKNNTTVYDGYSDMIRANMFPIDPVVMVNFSIGNPPVIQLALFDTGSPMIWVAMKNCTGCENKNVELYNPKESISYKEVPCYEGDACPDGCRSVISLRCYDVARYSSTGVICRGIRVKDEFSFTTAMDGVRLVPNSLFISCYQTKDIDDMDNRAYNGIFGLGSFEGSLVSMLGNKFSYCISNLHDPKNSFNKVYFGDEVKTFTNHENKANLFVNERGIYSVSLEMMYMDNEIIGFGPHHIVLDTGSPATLWNIRYLRLVKNVIEKVMSQMGIEQLKDERVCFYGDMGEDLLNLPILVIRFDGGGKLSLSPYNIFKQVTPAFYCLHMAESPVVGSSVLGLAAQQNHILTYDILDSKLYIQDISCSEYDLI